MSTVSNYVSQITESLKPKVKVAMDAAASRALDSRYLKKLHSEHIPYLKTQLPDISDSTLFVAAIGRDLNDELLYGNIGLKHIPETLLMKYWGTLDRWANNESYGLVEKKHVDKSVLRAKIESIFKKRKPGSDASTNGV